MIPESIKILAEDIYTSDYVKVHDCAITRALHRAGINGRDGVGVIYAENSFNNIAKFVEGDYQIVQGMYKYVEPQGWAEDLEAIEPRDFDLRIIHG